METPSDERWQAYGGALIEGMREVLAESPEDLHAHLLETADYWLSVGLAMGLRRPDDAQRLLELIESEEHDRTELEADAEAFLRGALG
jgi:hypothetical protein